MHGGLPDQIYEDIVASNDLEKDLGRKLEGFEIKIGSMVGYSF